MCIYILSTDVNHNVCMQYGIVESRRRGAGTSQLYMPSRSDFYKYAVEHFTSIDEVVLDVGDGKTFYLYTDPIKL